MNDMHVGAIDLNLLVALDALLRERNVTRAAKQVGLTQSAMSHALARLRALLEDELLVRSPSGMIPTKRGEALTPSIRRILEDVERTLAPTKFDPKTATGRIVIGTSDYCELVLMPTVVSTLAREAPGIDLRIVSIADDISEPLSVGAIDLVIAPPDSYRASAGILQKRLFDERFVCVVRKTHPLVNQKLTLARFAAARHALISPRGGEGGFVDVALARLGLERRVAVAVPHFLIAPHLVATSDLVLTVAQRVANVLAGPLKLAILTPPSELGLEGFRMSTLWHERTQASPMHRWMRELIEDAAKAI